MSNNEEHTPNTASAHYAKSQAKAETIKSNSHPGRDVRERAGRKVTQWLRIWHEMLGGRLTVGSRTPVSNTPAWATLEVIKGGFATGGLAAGGMRLPHETLLFEKIGKADSRSRNLLNDYYLTDDGAAELLAMLETGCYRIDVPEEGALLTVAYLVSEGKVDEAGTIVDELLPWFDDLRFYPRPADRPLLDGDNVFVKPVWTVVRNLEEMVTSYEVLKQREAIDVWAGMTDRLVALFGESVSGDMPALDEDSMVTGGWPCQHYLDGWSAQGHAFVDEFHKLRRTHSLCRKVDRKGENFRILREMLEKILYTPKMVTGRDVGLVRRVLACVNSRRGMPGDERCVRLREAQQAIARTPTAAELGHAVARRLKDLPQDEGLAEVDRYIDAISAAEAAETGLPEGRSVEFLRPKLMLALAAPVAKLIELGVITSAEVLGVTIPQITSQVASAGFADIRTRRLYSAIYQAFRRRRSLLLLNLESQVRLGELPWVKALSDGADPDAVTKEQARRTLVEVCTLAMSGFPHQILPNKLLRELDALAISAGLKLPLVFEIAADIFQRSFEAKFLRSAQIAGRLLKGTLYERYYDIDWADVEGIDDLERAWEKGPRTSKQFLNLCIMRSTGTNVGSWVAQNGTIIEQEQILTTHNLGTLFLELGIRERLSDRLVDMSRACFEWICRRLVQMPAKYQLKLRIVKNAAYAWRQMVFFVSMLPEQEQRDFVNWAERRLSESPEKLGTAFMPVIIGLANAVDGGVVDAPPSSRVFLGWSTGGHWLIEALDGKL